MERVNGHLSTVDYNACTILFHYCIFYKSVLIPKSQLEFFNLFFFIVHLNTEFTIRYRFAENRSTMLAHVQSRRLYSNHDRPATRLNAAPKRPNGQKYGPGPPPWKRYQKKTLGRQVEQTLEAVWQRTEWPNDETIASLWDLHRVRREQVIEWFQHRRRKARQGSVKKEEDPHDDDDWLDDESS